MKIFGYLDNSVIINAFMIPVYSDQMGELYFHRLCEQNKFIIGFDKIQYGYYQEDLNVLECNNDREFLVGDEGFFIVKGNNWVEVGDYTKIRNYLATNIQNGTIASKNLIKQAIALLSIT